MTVWILMCDSGFDYEPDISIYGVYKDEVTARANKLEAQNEDPGATFWVDEWEVE